MQVLVVGNDVFIRDSKWGARPSKHWKHVLAARLPYIMRFDRIKRSLKVHVWPNTALGAQEIAAEVRRVLREMKQGPYQAQAYKYGPPKPVQFRKIKPGSVVTCLAHTGYERAVSRNLITQTHKSLRVGLWREHDLVVRYDTEQMGYDEVCILIADLLAQKRDSNH